jgi:hypothetical protein
VFGEAIAFGHSENSTQLLLIKIQLLTADWLLHHLKKVLFQKTNIFLLITKQSSL